MGSRATEDERRRADADPFTPVAEVPRYAGAKATVGPDRSATWLKRAMPIVMAHKWIFLASLVGSFVGLIFQVMIPWVVQQGIDDTLVNGNHPLEWYVIAIALLGLARFGTNAVGRLYLFKTAYRIEYDLRTQVYEHLSTLSFPFYDRVQSGQLISRANSDIRSVQLYLAFAPSILVQCAVAVVAFVVMAIISLPLAIVAMATMPLVLVVGIRMRRRMFPVSWLTQARLADVATVVEENISGVRVVKSFAAEDRQLAELTRQSRRVEWGNVQESQVRARYAPLLENLPRFGLALVLLFGGWLVINGSATVGTIVAFNAYVLMLQPPFRMLGFLLMMSQRASASARRIYEVLDEHPDIVDRPGAVDLVTAEGDVHFDGVRFAYGDGPDVLDGLDLHLRPGDTVALVGRTGAGKSTVSRLLPRFYDVSDGAVRIDGTDVRDLTLRSLRAHVGMVLDEPFLFSVSIRDNIAYGRPGATDGEIVAVATAAGAHEFIEALPEGYETVIGERGYTLSGGQRQRISIARTLLRNPPVLVLDDATSAIDVQVEQQIHGALRELMRGRTTLIIAHRLSTISLADRVAVLDGGRILAEGTHAQLLATEPRYAEILATTGDGSSEAWEAEGEQLRADAVAVHDLEVDVAEVGLIGELRAGSVD